MFQFHFESVLFWLYFLRKYRALYTVLRVAFCCLLNSIIFQSYVPVFCTNAIFLWNIFADVLSVSSLRYRENLRYFQTVNEHSLKKFDAVVSMSSKICFLRSLQNLETLFLQLSSAVAHSDGQHRG